MSTATKPAIAYRLQFLSYADLTDTLVTTENFMAWDVKYNESREQKRLEEVYGKAEIYAIGLKELFRRELYSVKFSIPKGTVSLPSGVPRTTVVQSGAVVTNMTASQQDYLIEKTKQEMKNAARRLKLWGLTPAKLHKLLDEALED